MPLTGLYLSQRFGPPLVRSRPFVYTNFIASLDGRISLPDPRMLKRIVPPSIANARDWRLFQELAASADALVVSGRYVRDLPRGVSARSFPVSSKPHFADLIEWRRGRGLSPQPAVVIVTASLDLPPLDAVAESGRDVYVATGRTAPAGKAAAIEAQGANVVRAGSGALVEGGRLVEALTRNGYSNIAMISGGQVLEALVLDDVLDRLYLTLACRMLGGTSFDTLFTGPVLETAARFSLEALHYDAASASESASATAGGRDVEQLFAIFGRARGQGQASTDDE